VTDVENFKPKRYGISSYKACNIPIPKAEYSSIWRSGYHTNGTSIKAKLSNRGLPVMYLGRAANHSLS